MTAPVLFAYGTYLAALLCLLFCIRERAYGGWAHALWQIVILAVFCVLFYLLESWAGIRAPFYEYLAATGFPHMVDRFDFGQLAGTLNAFGVSGLAGLLGPGPAAAHQCAILPPPDTIPVCIPIGGGVIVFCLLWTVRLLMDSRGFAYEPFVPVNAPWIVGLMALWLDLSLDPVLANSIDCEKVPQAIHAGTEFWTWHTEPSLADWWFHIPAYNFGTWFSSPAILAALVILVQWLYLKITTNTPLVPADGALRALIVFFVGVVFFVSPNSAAFPVEIYTLILLIIVLGIWALIREWEFFRRDNPWRWELVVTLSFYFLFPVAAFLLTDHFVPRLQHIWLFLITLVVAGSGIFFAVSPYWHAPLSRPISQVVASIVLVMAVLGYLGNG